MAQYLGDFATGDIIYIEQCFVDSTGLNSVVTGGSACCRRMGQASLMNSGVGAITTSGGQIQMAIFTSSGSAGPGVLNVYSKGDYAVFMGAGTVNSISVIGYPLAQFSIGRTTAITYSSDIKQVLGSAVTAATAGILDVNAKNINNQVATAFTISANTVQWLQNAVSQAANGIPKVDIDTIKTNPVVNAGTITFPTTATLASTTNITAGTITTVTNLTNAPTNGDFTSTMKTSIQTAVTAVTVSADLKQWLSSTPNALISGRVDANVNSTITAATLSATVLGLTSAGATAVENAVWDATQASHVTLGTTGKSLSNASSAGDPWATAIPGAYTAGQAGNLVGNAINSSTFTMSANVTSINAVSTSPVTTVKAVQGLTTADQITTVSGNVNGSVGSVTGNVGGNVAGSVASVTAITTSNGTVTAGDIANGAANKIADSVLLRDLATGASSTDRNVQNALRPNRNKWTIAADGTVTVFKEDDITPAWTAATTTTTAVSINILDPA